jgi:nucleoid-associated protein YgaU
METEEIVRCQFRPTGFQLARTVSWGGGGAQAPGKSATRKNTPDPDYGGGSPTTLTGLKLLFDTYERHLDGDVVLNTPGQNVRTLTSKLWDMSLIQPSLKDEKNGQGRPPRVKFSWGRITFIGFITSISEDFKLFLPNGTPVRSEVTLAMREYVEPPTGTNPTSGGPAGVRVRTVTQGETLDWIAYQEYGDPNAWRLLADLNRLDDPRRLVPGQRLLIAPRP